jgi:riboflavin biosynthesis pyrimidine reductase
MLAAVRARGCGTVLTEGGPRLLGQLVADRLLNELFLTISPVLAGREDTTRPGLVAARELLLCRAPGPRMPWSRADPCKEAAGSRRDYEPGN